MMLILFNKFLQDILKVFTIIVIIYFLVFSLFEGLKTNNISVQTVKNLRKFDNLSSFWKSVVSTNSDIKLDYSILKRCDFRNQQVNNKQHISTSIFNALNGDLKGAYLQFTKDYCGNINSSSVTQLAYLLDAYGQYKVKKGDVLNGIEAMVIAENTWHYLINAHRFFYADTCIRFFQKGLFRQSLAVCRAGDNIIANADSAMILGRSLYELGDLSKASSAFEEAISRDDSRADAYYRLAIVRNDQGKVNEAISLLEKSIFIKPDYWEAISDLSTIYFQIGDFDESYETISRNISRLSPNQQVMARKLLDEILVKERLP